MKQEDVYLPQWERGYFEEGGDQPQLFYIIYGDFVDASLSVSRSKYFSDGIPEGIDLHFYEDNELEAMMWPLQDAPLKEVLEEDFLSLVQVAKSCRACMVIKGEVGDATTLNYLRDVVGIIAALFEQGGRVLCDLYTFSLWNVVDWKENFFTEHEVFPNRHVVILDSPNDEGTSWLHTRGMIKFGRPDLSVDNVEPEEKSHFVDMLIRFVNFQAFGGMIEEGHEVRVSNIPSGLCCYHAGDMDDPDFNNKHVVIR